MLHYSDTVMRMPTELFLLIFLNTTYFPGQNITRYNKNVASPLCLPASSTSTKFVTKKVYKTEKQCIFRCPINNSSTFQTCFK